MATESVKYVAPETQTSLKTKVFPRPGQHATGIIDWLTTIDHKKKIGLMYGLSACFSFCWWSRGIAYPFAIVGSQHGGSH